MPAEKAIQRNVMPSRGPRFYEDAGVVMFTYVIDPGSIVGPYPAREQDKREHPEAWTAYEAARNAAKAAQTETTSVVASEAAPGPTPMRRGPGRPRKKGAGDDASDHRPERV